MNPVAEPGRADDPSGVTRAIDQVCNRFEGAWRAGQRPRLEEYLTALPQAQRPVLLRELLPIEIDYRRAAGEDGLADEYRVRFPELDAAWLASVLAEEPPPTHGDGRRYRVLHFHARGGLGEVHVAFDAELRRQVALKRIQDRHRGDPEGYRRFLREAEITGRLEHPGVVPVHGLIHDGDGQPCYAMRLIEGESLKEALGRLHNPAGPPGPALTLRQLLTRFVTVCQTVAYAHSRGIVHRDLKPANIMLGKYGETLVVDWGLAKETGRQGDKETGRQGDKETGTGRALGTPAYMSPEQAVGRANAFGPAGDIFGLGATLYAVLTGRAPYGETPAEGPPPQARPGSFPPPSRVKPDVPRALEAICLKAMAWRPEDRYATALELAADLERWLAGEPVAAYPEPWAQRLGRWVVRHRTRVAGGAALVVGAVPVLALLVVLLERERARTAREYDAAQANAARAVSAMNQGRRAVFEMGFMAQSGVRSSKLIRQRNLRVARRTFGGFRQQYPDDTGLLVELAEFHFHYGWVCMEVGDWPEAIAALQEAVDDYGKILVQDPREKLRARRALCWLNLGLAYHALRRPAETEAAFREALAVQEPLTRANPQPVHQANLAEMYGSLGVFLRDTGRQAEAVTALRTAAAGWETALARAAEANAVLRAEAYRVGLVLDLARLGEFARARAHVPEMTRSLADEAREDVLYDAACAYALLAADARPGAPAEAHAAQAVALVRRAVAREFINLDRLRRDPDLNALRGRADFEAILDGLAERICTGFR